MAALQPSQSDISSALFEKLVLFKNESIVALGTLDFYLQLVFVCASILLALGITALLRRYNERSATSSDTQKFSHQFMQHTINLLAPVLTLVFLSLSNSVANSLSLKHWFIPGCAVLTTAWLIIRALSLIIRNPVIARSVGGIILLITLLDLAGMLAGTEEYLGSVAFEVGKLKLSLLSLIKGGFLFAVLFWLASAASHTTERYLRQQAQLNYNTRELILKLFNVLLFFVVGVTTLNFIGIDLTALAVFGGALGVGMGLGLQKITANFISGIILLLEKSIKPGDLVELNNEKGWVRELNVRYTLIETTDGREVLYPNEELVSNRVTNWTFTNKRARGEIQVTVSYASDVALVQKLMLEAAKEYERCLPFPLPECLLNNFGDNGLTFRLTFWINDITEGLAVARSEVMLRILAQFRAYNVTIPSSQHEIRIVGSDEVKSKQGL